MITADTYKQANFFDQEKYRLNSEKILNPPLHNLLELETIKKYLKMLPPKNILDFGCGSGRFTVFLLKQGYNVYAHDVSKKSLEALLKLYNSHKKSGWGKLYICPEIPDYMKFDMIVGSDILHHIHISSYLSKFRDKLKPDGAIVFSEPNPWHIPWYIFYLSFVSWEMEKGILNCSKKNIIREFRQAGFRDLHIEGHGLIPTPLLNFLPSLSSVNAKFGDISFLNNFAFRFIISAKK